MSSKRIFDLAVVVPGLLILLPLFVLISIIIKLDSPGPAYYIYTHSIANSVSALMEKPSVSGSSGQWVLTLKGRVVS